MTKQPDLDWFITLQEGPGRTRDVIIQAPSQEDARFHYQQEHPEAVVLLTRPARKHPC